MNINLSPGIFTAACAISLCVGCVFGAVVTSASPPSKASGSAQAGAPAELPSPEVIVQHVQELEARVKDLDCKLTYVCSCQGWTSFNKDLKKETEHYWDFEEAKVKHTPARLPPVHAIVPLTRK